MLDCDKVKLNASQRILQILFDARSIIAAITKENQRPHRFKISIYTNKIKQTTYFCL